MKALGIDIRVEAAVTHTADKRDRSAMARVIREQPINRSQRFHVEVGVKTRKAIEVKVARQVGSIDLAR